MRGQVCRCVCKNSLCRLCGGQIPLGCRALCSCIGRIRTGGVGTGIPRFTVKRPEQIPLAAIDERPAADADSVVRRGDGIRQNGRTDRSRFLLGCPRRVVSGITHTGKIRVALTVDLSGIGNVAIGIRRRGLQRAVLGIGELGRVAALRVGKECGVIGLQITGRCIHALVYNGQTVDNAANAVVSIHSGRAAHVIVARQGHHGGRSATVKQNGGLELQLLAEAREIFHGAGRTAAIRLGGGGNQQRRTVGAQTYDGAGIVGLVALLTRVTAIFNEGKEAADGLGYRGPLRLLGGVKIVAAHRAGKGNAVSHGILALDVIDGVAACRHHDGIRIDGRTRGLVAAFKNGGDLTRHVAGKAERGVARFDIQLVSILKSHAFGAAAMVVDDSGVGCGKTVDTLHHRGFIVGRIGQLNGHGGLADHVRAVGKHRKHRAERCGRTALHVVGLGEVVLVADLRRCPDLTVNDLQATGNGHVLDTGAGGSDTVAIIVGVVNDPRVSVDCGDHGGIRMRFVVLDSRRTHGRAAPVVGTAVEHLKGNVLGTVEVNNIDKTLAGQAVLTARGQGHLGQGHTGVLTVQLDVLRMDHISARDGIDFGIGRQGHGRRPKQQGCRQNQRQHFVFSFHSNLHSAEHGRFICKAPLKTLLARSFLKLPVVWV